MPDIKALVKKLLEEGESEDVIAAVVRKMEGSEIKSGLPDMSPELKTPDKDEYKGPDTFWGGVKNSLFGKEYDETTRKSLKGFAKGTAAIPDTLADTAHGLAAGVHSLIQDPKAHFRAMGPAFKEMGQGMWDITKNAGANPEEFGNLSGQIFGQEALLGGIPKVPGIAKATTGAINRVPIVNKTLSSVGRGLEGTRDPKILPASRSGLIAGAVRGAARPIGRGLQRVGERGRLAGGTRPPSPKTNIKLKGETETPHSPDSDIFAGGGEGATRPRPIRYDTPDLSRNSEFTRPVLEDTNTRAGRSAFSRRGANVADDIYPLDSNPPILETPNASAARGSYPPGGPSSRYRHRPYEQGQEAAAIVENAGQPKASPVESAFEPSVDPAKNFSFEDLQMMKTRRDEVNAILRKMANENDVDPTTGEISPGQVDRTFPGLPNGKRTQGKWGITRPDEGAKFADNVNEEMGYFGGEQNSGMVNDSGMPDAPQRYPGDEAFDLGEINPGFRNTQSMPDWGPSEQAELFRGEHPDNAWMREINGDDAGRYFTTDRDRASRIYGGGDTGEGGKGSLFSTKIPKSDLAGYATDHGIKGEYLLPREIAEAARTPTVARPVNPLRPEVPPGQVSNRRMFELSEQRAAEMKAAEAQQFNDSIGHEFDQDMMFTPDELRPTEVPQFTSPFENQFDPRISNTAPFGSPDPTSPWGVKLPNERQTVGGFEQPPLTPRDLELGGGAFDRSGPVPEVPIGEPPRVPIAGDQSLARTIQPEEWGDWGGLEADIPTLVPDASGSHVAAPRKSQFSAGANEEAGFFGPDKTPDSANDIFEEPQFARVGKGRAKIGVDVKHAAGELTTGYSQPLPAVMVREGLQNAMDAVNDLGPNGNVNIRLTDKDGAPKTIEIQDNGKGMSEKELYTVYTDLHSSGKANDPNATGGKGVGKAVYMLGGDSFEVVTVKNIKGQKIQSSFSGTPDELLAGFDVKSEVVSPDTPTGTRFKTTLKGDQEMMYARSALNNITKYSRGRHNKLRAKKSQWDEEADIPWTDSSTDNKIISDVSISNNSSKMDTFIPKDSELGQRSMIEIEVLNNGMWQFREHMYLDEATNGIPDKIIVDIKPKVAEGTPDYPFPVQRENMKDTAKADMFIALKENLVNPMAGQRKHDLQKLWDQMVPTKAPGAHRESVFFDPGDRLTASESSYVTNSPVVKKLQLVVDGMLNDILTASGIPYNQSKVVRTGLTMDPSLYGVHIPNPGIKDTSAIFINVFQHMKKKNPRDASIDTVTTGLHEAAHVGKDTPSDTVMAPIDLDDPRVGRYLQSYIQHTMEQGGLDMGHGMPFIKRLGDMYAKTGTGTALKYADEFEQLITGESGGYSPEVQELLRIYDESRGRPATSEDILSGTGIKQADRGSGKGNIPGNDNPNGAGVPKLVGGKASKSAFKPKTELFDHRVTDPNGKHLGDIVITEERIKTLQKHPAFKDMTREQVIEQLHGAQLETILAKAKIPENARTRVKVEPIDYNTNKTIPQETPADLPADSGMYKIQSQEGADFPNDTFAGPNKMGLDAGRGREFSDVGEFGAESLTDFSGTTGPPVKTKPSAFNTSTKVTLNPDKDFGPGGDIGPIVQEVRRLSMDGAVDSRYRKLLPEIMRNELGPGETWKGKLDRLIEEIQTEQQMSPEAGAARLREMEAEFEESTRGFTAPNPDELPPVRMNDININKLRPSTLNSQQKPWVSPRVQQQFNSLFRTRTGQPPKKPKK